MGNSEMLEHFLQWFVQVQKRLADDEEEGEIQAQIIQSSLLQQSLRGDKGKSQKNADEENEDEEDELSLDQKQILEKVKKYRHDFLNADVLLELGEDERRQSDFVLQFCPLEAFALLGALVFFDAYLFSRSKGWERLKIAEKFVDTYENNNSKGAKGAGSLVAMRKILRGLRDYFPDESFSNQDLQRASNGEDAATGEVDAAMLGIQYHFVCAFNTDELFDLRSALVKKITEQENTNPELYLYQYLTRRAIRLHENTGGRSVNPSDLEAEKSMVLKLTESLQESDNPWVSLAFCQFLPDYMQGKGTTQVNFGDKKLQSHTDMVKFISETASKTTEKYPSFLRAYFTFADIFANDLPITRIDRTYAKSLLEKALNLNPKSSKINYKMGMFAMKGRQFNESRNYFRKSIELDPDNAMASYSLVKLFLRDPTSYEEDLETILETDLARLNQILGPENELPFWKGCYFFMKGEPEVSVVLWVEVILEFYVTKPEVDLATVLPFKDLPRVADLYHWPREPLNLQNVSDAVKEAISGEKSRSKIVLQRLGDLVQEAIKHSST